MRCNVGVNPLFLLDQWLIAEYRELPMVVGSLRVNNWIVKSPIKPTFCLGTGHLNFFKNKLYYLHKRHEEVKKEMVNRGFKCDVLSIDIAICPNEYVNNWTPSTVDSWLIRNRLVEKLTKNKLPITWWRYKHQNLAHNTLNTYLYNIVNSELYFV